MQFVWEVLARLSYTVAYTKSAGMLTEGAFLHSNACAPRPGDCPC